MEHKSRNKTKIVTMTSIDIAKQWQSTGGMLTHDLETFTMDNTGTRLVVLLLRDPHLLESGQRGQDRATDPYRVLPLGRSDDLDLHRAGSEGGDLLLHAVSDAREHGSTTREDGVGIEILPDIHITLHDAVVGGLVDATRLHAEE